LLLTPPGSNPEWRSHAQGPTVLPVSDSLWRIYFSGRNGQNSSRVFAADFDPRTMQIIEVYDKPVLTTCASGAFDEHGVGAGTAIREGRRVLLYYVGLRLSEDVPYRIGIGLAVSEDDGLTFTRVHNTPIVGISRENPWGVSTPSVFRDGHSWAMWYSSFRAWRLVDGKPEPVYDLRRAISEDGRVWCPDDFASLGYPLSTDGGLIRANFVESRNGVRLIASERNWRDFRAGEGGGYHLILAAPTQGRTPWQRVPETIRFDPSEPAQDWDSDMQCYPWLIRHEGRNILFYNGNDFGRHGFGVAELVEDGGGNR